jgi:hypothetical protein
MAAVAMEADLMATPAVDAAAVAVAPVVADTGN